MAAIGNGVTMKGLYSDDFMYTWLLSGTGGTSPGIGAAMMQDTSVDNTAKVPTDGATLIGQLASYENRIQEGVIVGTIKHKGNFEFDYTGTAPVRGNSVVGSATAGKVKDSGAAATGIANRVLSVNTTALTCVVMFG